MRSNIGQTRCRSRQSLPKDAVYARPEEAILQKAEHPEGSVVNVIHQLNEIITNRLPTGVWTTGEAPDQFSSKGKNTTGSLSNAEFRSSRRAAASQVRLDAKQPTLPERDMNTADGIGRAYMRELFAFASRYQRAIQCPRLLCTPTSIARFYFKLLLQEIENNRDLNIYASDCVLLRMMQGSLADNYLVWS